jgi:CNT family concentrative nucleoside transporter
MAERLVSFLGLLVLLGLAYLFSSNRRAVSFRTVVWGVGLQLTFAVIILSGGVYSFAGMFVLVFLILLFLLQREFGEEVRGRWLLGAGVLAVGAGVVFAGHRLSALGVTPWLLGIAVVTALVTTRLREPHFVRYASGVALLLGLGELWARGIDGGALFQLLSSNVAAFLDLSNEGARFLFGNLVDPQYFFPGEDSFWPGFGFQFAFSVLPTIIFFSAFMSVMYYLGVVQKVISAMARFMHWSMKTSGSETVSCSANVFVGQTEAPFLVKPFLKDMTLSELHAIMVGGFATIAGGVLAGYIQMGVNPGHLIAASVMSAPAALVVAKLLFPETEHSVTAGDVEIPKIETADNVVGAAANGTTDGLKLALNVGAMLIAFISLIALVDVVLGFFDGLIDGQLLKGAEIAASGEFRGIVPGSLKTFFGTLLAPLAFVMGVPWVDAREVGNLLGVKLSVNEFVAYGLLSEHLHAADLQPRSIVIATYALCGFANFSSIGIQIGGIGAIAPERRAELAKIGVRAMFGGALASFTTATIAGILL